MLDTNVIHVHTNSLTIHCCHDEPNLSCVCSTSEVRIDILSVALVERNETVKDIVTSSIFIIATFSQSAPSRVPNIKSQQYLHNRGSNSSLVRLVACPGTYQSCLRRG